MRNAEITKTGVLSKITYKKGEMPVHLPGKEPMLFPKKPQKKKRKIHPKSILHSKEDRTCYLCMLLDNNYTQHIILQEHHIFGGPNREHSEETGLKVYLCPDHHTMGRLAVHNCQETMDLLHKIGQRKYEETHTREEFMKLFGKNYLEV